MASLETIFVFLFGASIGSFANVCIYRLPRDLSVATPRSMCTRCGSRVRAFDNLPLISYLLLRGRCRDCGTPFSARYWFIELSVAIFCLWLVRHYGISFQTIYIFILAVSLWVVTWIDIDHRIIPDRISISGIWIGLAVAGLRQWIGMPWMVTFYEALLGAAIGWGLLWGVAKTYEAITAREGLGFGDVKLVALFGAHVGAQGVLASLFLGALMGSVVGLFLILFAGKNRRYAIPFGPYLCAGFALYALNPNLLEQFLSRLF